MENTDERITTMDAILFAIVLEMVLLQLRILAEGHSRKMNEGRSSELRARHWKALNKNGRLEWDKLFHDREYLENVLRTTLIEVAEGRVYESISQAVVYLKELANSADELRLRFQHYKDKSVTIALELENTQRTHGTLHREADMKIAILRDNIKDAQNNTNARLNYAEKWLRAKQESLELQHTIKTVPANIPKADHEIRIHEELLRAYELQIKELETKQDYWRFKYVDDTAVITEKVSKKREQLEIAVTRRKELQNLYDLHAREMRAWLTFKSERAARLAREKHLNEAAVLLQAWWRGVMVRRALGQFKNLKNIKKPSNINKKK